MAEINNYENFAIDDDDDTTTALLAIVAATATLVKNQNTGAIARRKAKKRKVWTSTLLRQRCSKGVWASVIPDLQPGPGNRVKGSFSNYFRMDEGSFEALLTNVAPLIRRQDTHLRSAVSPQQRLAVTLRYLATGCSYTELYYNFRISVALISKIVPETCKAIYQVLKNEYLTTPNTPERWVEISRNLYQRWQFPNTLGALDGKHIVMTKPWHSGSYYHNYKGSESIVLLAMCDANYR